LVDGTVVVAFSAQGNNIDFRRFDANLVAIDPADRTDLSVQAAGQFGPALTALSTGEFIIAYQDNNSPPGPANQNVKLQLFSATGTTVGAAIDVAVTADVEFRPAVTALAGGGYVVAWHEDTGNERIQLRIYTNAGGIVATNLQVSNAVETDITGTEVVALSDGRFLVAWTNFDSLVDDPLDGARGQIFNADGSISVSEFRLNTTTLGNQELRDIAALPDGRFVAAYSTVDGLMVQEFDSAGNRVGPEVFVSASAGTTRISALEDGRFVVSYTDSDAQGGDLSGSAVRFQVFDPRDGVVTGSGDAETLLGHDLVNDEINGLGGADFLDGLGGTDVLIGGEGNDTYRVGAGDTIIESNSANSGTDTVQSALSYTLGANLEDLTLTGAAAINGTGNTVVNTITGNGANNILNGGADNVVDVLIGGLGNDTYVLGAGIDTVTEAAGNTGGIDTATSTVSRNLGVGLVDVENLIMLAAGTATGNGLNNVLDGTQFAGVNALIGGLGNDTYVLGNGNDTVTEANGNTGGIDTATSTIARSLSVGGLVNVENLIMLGAGLGTGNGLNNVLDGSQFAGANTLRGLAGNDTYFIGLGDVVDETAAGSGGSDTVRSLTGHTLGANVENLVLLGTAVNGVGNGLANTITGNGLANTLIGAGGIDILNGGLGNDTLTGGIDNDVFVINTVPNGATNRDLITDLNEAGDDLVRLENTGAGLFNALALGVLAANAYTENTAGVATAATHRIIYEIDTGMLRYDSNGNLAGGTIVHFATLDANQAALYSNADFLVI
jgi:Ca2+-binding RTX toxin-like protein